MKGEVQSGNSKDSPIEEDEQQTCKYCHKKGHIARDCRLRAKNAANTIQGSEDCPVCNKTHTHTRKRDGK